MNDASSNHLVSLLFTLAIGSATIATAGCSESQAQSQPATAAQAPAAPTLTNAPLAAHQVELLDIAMRAASALPVEPHLKTRSRAQESVVVACLELDQPQRALEYLADIDNWRRGAAYADLASYCADNDQPKDAEHFLELARRIADGVEDDSAEDGQGQGWRKDRIKAKIAQTYVALGQHARAAQYEAGLADSEVGRVAAARAKRTDAATFDVQLVALQEIAKTGSFEQLGSALNTCAQLFDGFYDDVERRTRVEETIESLWTKLPLMVRIETKMDLIEFALDRLDHDKALELVDETQAIVDAGRWTPEDHIALMARLARARHRSGDAARARADADAAAALFEEKRGEIVDIYRAGALRPLAEAYHAIGDVEAALATYARAVEEGVQNPNARPRVEDLTATCVSMARTAVEPSAELRARIAAVHSGLGSPW